MRTPRSSKVGVGAPALVQSKAARMLATAVTFISVTGFASPADAGAHRLMKPNLAHLRLGNSMPKLWTWHMGWTLESERFEKSDCDSRSLRIQQARIEPLPSLSIRYPPARSVLLFGGSLRVGC